MKKKFFKDPKINQISCKDFFLSTNFLRNCKNNWNSKNLPIAYIPYYRITENLLIKIVYRYRLINYGMDMCLAFDHIDVAFRDGLNEYNCFLNDLKDLKQESIKHPKSKKILQNIKNLTNNINYIKRKLPAFTKMYELNKGDKEFKDSLIKNLYKAIDKNLSRDYVVLDLETNGLRSANDDLLSISIYDPLKGVAYNRF